MKKLFVGILMIMVMVGFAGVVDVKADVIDDMIRDGYMKIQLSKDNVQISIERKVYNTLTYTVKMNTCAYCCKKYNRPSAAMFYLGTDTLVVLYNPKEGIMQVYDR